jgi:hypothetical protein
VFGQYRTPNSDVRVPACRSAVAHRKDQAVASCDVRLGYRVTREYCSFE